MEREYYKRTGIYPIMHLVAIKKDIYERYPFVASSLYDAFVESKKIAMKHMFNLRALRYMTPFLMRDIDEIYGIFNGDPWPYGVEKNPQDAGSARHLSRRSSTCRSHVKVDDLFFVPTYG
jgi:4,5-dihydroxyphthalate decarboxylase